MKEFLLSDESVNSHGQIIMTDGIELGRFLANPVMFYNHDHDKGIIGRWENVRKSDGKLYATPVFDTNSELGRMVKQQVESGFLRAASIGIGDVEFEYNPTESEPQKIIRCELLEASVCDIPSNRNTLQLYYKGRPVDGGTYRQLTTKSAAEEDISAILEALELPESATLEDAVAAIRKLKGNDKASCEEQVETAIKNGYIKPDEKIGLLKGFAGNRAGLSTFLKYRRQSFEKQIDAEYNKLINVNGSQLSVVKLRAIPQEDIKTLIRTNFVTFRRILACIKPFRRVMDDIVQPNNSRPEKQNWTLEDYRKNDPMELRRNPGLYQRLLKQQSNK